MTDNRSWRGATTIAVFGRRAVLDALVAAGAGHLEAREVRVSRDTPKSYRTDLRGTCRALGLEPIECGKREVNELSRDARHDQGVAALVDLRGITPVDSFVADVHGPRAKRPTRLIAMDGVTNPQNVGMIVRSALAAGMDGVLWPMDGAPWVSGLIIKASAGAVFRTPIATCDTLTDGLRELRGRGFRVISLMGGGDVSVFDHTPPHRAVYVVGSETLGVSSDVEAETDERVAIPMANDVESLNAAVAAGVVSFVVAGGSRPDRARARPPKRSSG